jgi:hypothetical protein
VADVDDEDEKFVVENAVVDAVVADADAVGVVAGGSKKGTSLIKNQ